MTLTIFPFGVSFGAVEQLEIKLKPEIKLKRAQILIKWRAKDIGGSVRLKIKTSSISYRIDVIFKAKEA